MALSHSARQLMTRTVGTLLSISNSAFNEFDYQADRFINKDEDKSLELLYESAADLIISALEVCYVADSEADKYEVERKIRHCVLMKLRESENRSLNR